MTSRFVWHGKMIPNVYRRADSIFLLDKLTQNGLGSWTRVFCYTSYDFGNVQNISGAVSLELLVLNSFFLHGVEYEFVSHIYFLQPYKKTRKRRAHQIRNRAPRTRRGRKSLQHTQRFTAPQRLVTMSPPPGTFLQTNFCIKGTTLCLWLQGHPTLFGQKK